MNEILTINYESENPTVSARDLHEVLGIRERFSLWFSRYADVFEKGTDYESVGKPTVANNGAKRVIDDYLLSTDMAKHISMMTKPKKGKSCASISLTWRKHGTHRNRSLQGR